MELQIKYKYGIKCKNEDKEEFIYSVIEKTFPINLKREVTIKYF